MTDINVLILQLKAGLRAAHDAWTDSNGGKVTLGWLHTATPPAITLLIEALEAKDAECKYLSDELEGATAHVVLLKISLSQVMRETDEKDTRIAELQSRAEAAESIAVTVTLPERYDIEMWPSPAPDGEWYSRNDILESLAAAGIQIQGGE